jgi:hypothetical protein
MKRLCRAAVALIAAHLWAAPSYYLTDNLTSVDPLKWVAVGAASPAATGLSAVDPAGGSLISRIPIPDGTAEAEVRVTFKLAVSGGTYTLFLQATPDARTGGAGGGSYVAFEMRNPQFDAQGHCTADFVVLQSVAAATTLRAAFQHGCRDGMQMRMALHSGVLLLWPDQADPMEFPVNGSGSGQPGIGAYGTPAGNAISEVQLGAIDRVAPSAIDPQKIGISAFRNHIDVQWQPVTDDPAGSGLAGYWIARDGLYFMRTTATMFQDLTVKPNETHVYSVVSVDQHYNFSTPVTFTVSTPVPQNGPQPGNLPPALVSR